MVVCQRLVWCGWNRLHHRTQISSCNARRAGTEKEGQGNKNRSTEPATDASNHMGILEEKDTNANRH